MNEKKLRETLIFLSKLIVLSMPLYFVIWFADLGWLQEIVSRTVSSFFGDSAQREGFQIVVDGFSFYISKDCTGWKGMLFLTALIFATKSSWKNRLAGLALGLPAVFAFNLLRIVFMIWLGVSNPEFFGLFHDLLWQLSMIGAVLVLWLMWTKTDFNKPGGKGNE